MRLLCVDDSPNKHGDIPEVIANEYYTKCGERVGENGVLHYESVETVHYYGASRFIPISDISETEMERNYNFKTEEV